MARPLALFATSAGGQGNPESAIARVRTALSGLLCCVKILAPLLYPSSVCCLCLPLQTLAEREAALVDAEQTTRQPAERVEERRRQTQELVSQAQLQNEQQVCVVCHRQRMHLPSCMPIAGARGFCGACCSGHSVYPAPQEAAGTAAPDLNTDDDNDEVEEFEAWRERELRRIARDR